MHGQFEGTGKNRRVYIEDLGIVDNFMASDDLNICVEALLHKRPKHNPASRSRSSIVSGAFGMPAS